MIIIGLLNLADTLVDQFFFVCFFFLNRESEALFEKLWPSRYRAKMRF